MGLKEDLISRARSGDTFGKQSTKPTKNRETDIKEQPDDLDLDLSDELDEELDRLEDSDSLEDIDLTSELNSLDDFNDYQEQPEPEPEPAPRKRSSRNPQDKREQPRHDPAAQEPESEQDDYEQDMPYYGTGYQRNEPAYISREQTRPVREPVRRQEPVAEQHASYSQQESSDLKERLLDLAKETVLKGVLTSFESEIVTTKALSKMIESYLDNRSVSSVTNGNAILSAVVDELIQAEYSESQYCDLTKDILLSVKSDL